MIHLLNLLAAIALLVWSTYLVRTGMLLAFDQPMWLEEAGWLSR